MGDKDFGLRNGSIKLTVIVPVYNVEKYVARCIESILSQTYQNLEIIVVNDGSSDRSGEICDEYARKDSRVQVIHKENGGIVSARKAGILCATGEYTTNVDSDDWIECEAYEKMIQRLEEYHPDMLVMGYKKEYDGFIEECLENMEDGYYEKALFWKMFNEKIEKEAFFCQPIDMSLCNKAIKTEYWKEHQLSCTTKLRKNVDDAVVFPCLLNMNSIYIESKCYYHYCVRKNSILWNSKEEDFKRYILLAERLLNEYSKNQENISMDKCFLVYKLLHHLMLDVPEKLISNIECRIYPKVIPKSNIIVYGKGVFANRLMQRIEELQYCNIIDNIDRTDAWKLKQIDEKEYDCIVIAIFNSTIVAEARREVAKHGINEDKVIYIEKENLTYDVLPDEVKSKWKEYLGK